MPKLSSTYVCQQCGYKSPQFLGRCPECGAWNSLVEEVEQVKSSKLKVKSDGKAQIINLVDIKKEHFERLSSGIGEFDRVLGGGIVKGSVVLVAGDPGIGKSTLLTQLALNIDSEKLSKLKKTRESDNLKNRNSDRPDSLSTSESFRNGTLYIAGEESAHQIKMRVERIKPGADLAVLNEVDVDVICETINLARPGLVRLVIVDSIQTLETDDLESVAGSVGQVRESAHRLQKIAKANHIPIFLVGHVTKEGTVAGPKTLEHVVDVVLSLEGDPQSSFRILRANKNRFGSTNEVGIFDMEEGGMVEVKNPSKLFLSEKVNAPGSVIVPIITGLRPILVEIQALTTKTNLSFPRRVGTGIDNNRLQLLVAILQKRLGLPLYEQDVFVNVTGGIKVFEPAADLGICMAIISSLQDKTVPPKTAFVGEVGLLGELRQVREVDKRIGEARKLGYTNVVTPDKVKTLSGVVKLTLQ